MYVVTVSNKDGSINGWVSGLSYDGNGEAFVASVVNREDAFVFSCEISANAFVVAHMGDVGFEFGGVAERL